MFLKFIANKICFICAIFTSFFNFGIFHKVVLTNLLWMGCHTFQGLQDVTLLAAAMLQHQRRHIDIPILSTTISYVRFASCGQLRDRNLLCHIISRKPTFDWIIFTALLLSTNRWHHLIDINICCICDNIVILPSQEQYIAIIYKLMI